MAGQGDQAAMLPDELPGYSLDQSTTSSVDFPVVGIGASAGGLEALEVFFDNVPSDTRMAFIVVQHLSPDFKSMMAQLLARHTTLTIHNVEQGMRVQPGSVYLIPPKKEMIISGGKLRLTDKVDSQAPHFPIDQFFRSLAQDVGEKAIGVVLSGTGSDGSRGICEIHAAGGLVLVQSESTAKFDGMPKAAIGTGVVDLDLAPADLPGAIVKYGEYADLDLDSDDEDPKNRYFAIFRLLRREYGINFTHYKSSTVQRRIDRRLALKNVPTLRSYSEHLANDPDELNALYRDLLIGVTKFFRDAEAFEHLQSSAIARLLDEAKDE